MHNVVLSHTYFFTSITPELPIDIVYTWVNGSDPVLLEGLKQLKEKVLAEQSKQKQKEAKAQ